MARTGIMIGYARVSTRDQNTKAQEQELIDYGVDPDNIFKEKVSGVSQRRPRLDEAMAKCDKGDTFVVVKLDRFGRSIIDLLTRMKYLEDRGVGFVSIKDSIDTTSPAGRLLLNVLASIAQFERDLISERTRAGIQYKIKHEGYRPGPAPKLDGKPRKRAQQLRNQFKTVPEIAQAIEDEFGIKVSAKTLYLQTTAPGKGKK